MVKRYKFIIYGVMIERFVNRTDFDSYADFAQNFKLNIPDNFNFAYDVVDAWAAEEPDREALLWTNPEGEERRFTFRDLKELSDRTASSPDRVQFPEPRSRPRHPGDAYSQEALSVLARNDGAP